MEAKVAHEKAAGARLHAHIEAVKAERMSFRFKYSKLNQDCSSEELQIEPFQAEVNQYQADVAGDLATNSNLILQVE
uniref:Uncharacterized protein n=1 Tax=Hyaloperonospora arabidopsidis (strain Emoy2) TaxID=559515 RepID=M4BPI4_HYAAE